MFGTWGRTPISGLLLAACAACGLLAVGLPVARAGEGPEMSPPPGAPGGAAKASATMLYNELSYRGTVTRGAQRWYKFKSNGPGRILVEVWGRTRSCPVRAVLLDARGRPLSALFSSDREILPFAAPLPAHPIANTYYLRIDADPYLSCARASYVFKLIEPEQPGAPVAVPLEPAATISQVPHSAMAPSREADWLESGRCDSALYALSSATVAVEVERYRWRHHRASIGAVRSVERHKLTVRRRERAICGYE